MAVRKSSAGYPRAFFLPTDCGTLGGVITYQIPALPGVTRTDWDSAAYGVNKLGQVVGYSQAQQKDIRVSPHF